MKPKIISITHRQDEAWQAYVECERRAKRSLKTEDGRRAGLAWRRFINCFLPRDLAARLGEDSDGMAG